MDRLDDGLLHWVLCFLDGADLTQAPVVCRRWHYAVLEGELWKQLIVKLYPEARVLDPHTNALDRHNIYRHLYASLLTTPTQSQCLECALKASSTDHPEEHIRNTIVPPLLMDVEDTYFTSFEYWSSTGQRDPDVPEWAIYQLSAPLCLVEKISIRPFRAYFQPNDPIYSAEHVQFKLGGRRNREERREVEKEDYGWLYVSPKFPMKQEDTLQSFTLPRPVICIGGSLCVEYLGRVQRQSIDDLYYICVAYIEVAGKCLSVAMKRCYPDGGVSLVNDTVFQQ